MLEEGGDIEHRAQRLVGMNRRVRKKSREEIGIVRGYTLQDPVTGVIWG